MLPSDPISVTGPDGSSWTVDTATISGASVTAPVEPTGPAGRYILAYTVTAVDGDAVKGECDFTLTTAATPTTSAAAPTTAASPVGRHRRRRLPQPPVARAAVRPSCSGSRSP